MGTYTSIFDIGLASGAILMAYMVHAIPYRWIFIACAMLVVFSLLLYFLPRTKAKEMV